jgi:hypothetical protein
MNFFFQGSYGFGEHKNFEVVIPHPDGGLSHYWRDNEDPALPWRGPIRFGTGQDIRGTAVIESTYGPGGNFELVVVNGSHLDFYWRENFEWHGPVPIPLPHGVGVMGGPSLFLLSSEDLSLVVPNAQGGLIFMRRDHDTFQWEPPGFLGNKYSSGVSIGAYLAVEVVSAEDDSLVFRGVVPTKVKYSTGLGGTPAMLKTDYDYFEIIAPVVEGGLAHFYGSEQGWQRYNFGSGNYHAVSLVQSSYTGGDADGNYHGNFEVVAVRRDRLGFDFYWRDSLTLEWSHPFHVF